jgi:putative tryptophan/tyrosine transport system substrate-binding protein
MGNVKETPEDKARVRFLRYAKKASRKRKPAPKSHSIRKYGYIIDQNLVLDGPRGRFAEFSGLSQVLGDLRTRKVDVVVTIGYPTALAAKESGIPTVVVYGAGDPIATGLVGRLDRPGGSITGISDVASTLTTKRLGLLKQLAPGIRRVAIIWNRDDLGM